MKGYVYSPKVKRNNGFHSTRSWRDNGRNFIFLVI